MVSALAPKRCDLSHWLGLRLTAFPHEPPCPHHPGAMRACVCVCHARAGQAASTTWQSHEAPRDTLVAMRACDWWEAGTGRTASRGHPGKWGRVCAVLPQVGMGQSPLRDDSQAGGAGWRLGKSAVHIAAERLESSSQRSGLVSNN